MERTCQRCVLTRCPQADGRYFTCLRDECLQPGGSLCASGTHTALLLFVAAAVLRASLAECDAPASGRVHDEINQVGQVVLSTACDAARNSMFQRTHFYTFNDCGGSCSDAAKHQPMPACPLVHCVSCTPSCTPLRHQMQQPASPYCAHAMQAEELATWRREAKELRLQLSALVAKHGLPPRDSYEGDANMATLLASIAAQASIDAVSASKPNEASSNVSSESGANDEEITVAELQQENEQLRCGVFASALLVGHD